jgi:hypothetical protein
VATYDEWGNALPEASPSAPGAENTFGAALWAFFHPGQVQKEYVAVGKPPPTVDEIMSSAVTDMETHAGKGVADMIATGKWLMLGLGVLAAVYVVRELTRGR